MKRGCRPNLQPLFLLPFLSKFVRINICFSLVEYDNVAKKDEIKLSSFFTGKAVL